MNSGPPAERLTKRTMVAVSHAIERAALAAAEDGPLVVVALFQRLPYFERERSVYARIARRAAATVVGLVDERPPTMPDAAHAVLLGGAEELAREWTVVALTPRFGAVLTAYDREEVAPGASTLESGRLFDGWWRFRRDDALHELIRLRRALDDRLPPATAVAVDRVVERVRELPSAPGESRVDSAVRLLVRDLDRSLRMGDDLRVRLAGAARTAGAADGSAGLADEAAVRRWSGADGTTASGTLPVALVAVRVGEPAAPPTRLGRRSAARELEAVLHAVGTGLRPVDRVTRLAERDFLLILPALSDEAAVAAAYQVGRNLANLVESYPFVAFTSNAVVTVTRRRPLPVDQMRQALDWAVSQGVPVATLAPEPASV